MRFFPLVILLALSACTSMLIGGAPSAEGSISADSRTAYQVNQDNALAERIRREFRRDSDIRRFDIAIESYEYVVTLSGTVNSFEVRDRVVEIARNADLVRSVKNQVTVNTNL